MNIANLRFAVWQSSIPEASKTIVTKANSSEMSKTAYLNIFVAEFTYIFI